MSCLVLLVVLSGCIGKPEVPSMAELLPAGHREAAVPPEFKSEMQGSFGKDLVWMRCIDCDLDWDGLARHVGGAVTRYGYQDTSTMWIKALGGEFKDSGMTDDQLRTFMKYYSKPSGYGGLVIMFNLKFIKDLGGSVGTGGDFLILVGYDDISQY